MSQLAKDIFGQRYQDIRHNMDDLLIPHYKSLPIDNPYLFRGCDYDEIELLINSGYINAIENIDKSDFGFRNLYLNKSIEYSLYYGGNRFCVVYDRDKILKQGGIIIPDTVHTPVAEFEKIVPREWFEDEGYKLYENGEEPPNYEGYDWDESIDESLSMNSKFTRETIPIGNLICRDFVDEVIIKEIRLEPGLIKDIVIYIEDENFAYENEQFVFSKFLDLIHLLENKISR
jgi:hypothetical protein